LHVDGFEHEGFDGPEARLDPGNVRGRESMIQVRVRRDFHADMMST
jgi:hypothetical protein